MSKIQSAFLFVVAFMIVGAFAPDASRAATCEDVCTYTCPCWYACKLTETSTSNVNCGFIGVCAEGPVSTVPDEDPNAGPSFLSTASSMPAISSSVRTTDDGATVDAIQLDVGAIAVAPVEGDANP